MRGGAVFLLAVGLTTAASAQVSDPFVRPPPGQAPRAPAPQLPAPQSPQVPAIPSPSVPSPGLPAPAPGASTTALETLVKQGFEVKAMDRTSNTSADFVIMLQRSGEIRTCLMRLSRDSNRQLKRDSVCF